MFEAWMNEVDRLMLRLIGCTSDDVEDFDWWARFDDGNTPTEAVTDWRDNVLWAYGVGTNDQHIHI